MPASVQPEMVKVLVGLYSGRITSRFTLVNTQIVVMDMKDELIFIFHTIFPWYFSKGKQLHLFFRLGK